MKSTPCSDTNTKYTIYQIFASYEGYWSKTYPKKDLEFNEREKGLCYMDVCGDNLYYMIPAKYLWADKRTHTMNEPFELFTASGECWQKTGEHGTFDFSKAVIAVEKMSKYNPGIKFKVVKKEVEIITEIVAQISIDQPAKNIASWAAQHSQSKHISEEVIRENIRYSP